MFIFTQCFYLSQLFEIIIYKPVLWPSPAFLSCLVWAGRDDLEQQEVHLQASPREGGFSHPEAQALVQSVLQREQPAAAIPAQHFGLLTSLKCRRRDEQRRCQVRVDINQTAQRRGSSIDFCRSYIINPRRKGGLTCLWDGTGRSFKSLNLTLNLRSFIYSGAYSCGVSWLD